MEIVMQDKKGFVRTNVLIIESQSLVKLTRAAQFTTDCFVLRTVNYCTKCHI